MLSSEPPKGGGGMQTDSSSVSALPPNTDTNSGSDPKVVINLSSSSKSDLTSVLRPPAMASSLSTLEIAPKLLERTSLAPPTESKRSLDEVTPSLSEHGLVDNCLSTTSADATKATNDEAWEGYDANFDVAQHSRILKSLKSIASEVDENEDDTIFPIITAESRNKTLHLLVNNCNQVSLFTRRSVKNVGATIYNGTKITMHGLGDVQGTCSDKYATLELAFAGRSLKIDGLIVDTICTNINMSKPSIAKDGLDLTMDFNGKDVANFEISALIGLDVIAKLISPNNNSEIPMKKVDDIILIQIGNKHLPFVSASSKDSTPKRKSLIALGGPSNVKSAF